MQYAIIDLETTGLDPLRHEICEISIVLINEDLMEVNKFTSKIKPDHMNRIDEEALEVNKFTLDELETFPSSVRVRGLLNTWKEDVLGDQEIIPIGHNVMFDLSFLREYLQDTYKQWFNYRKVDTKGLFDTLKLLGEFPKDESTSLSELSERMCIPHKPHNAYEDCMAVLSLLRRLRGNLSINLDNIFED